MDTSIGTNAKKSKIEIAFAQAGYIYDWPTATINTQNKKVIAIAYKVSGFFYGDKGRIIVLEDDTEIEISNDNGTIVGNYGNMAIWYNNKQYKNAKIKQTKIKCYGETGHWSVNATTYI